MESETKGGGRQFLNKQELFGKQSWLGPEVKSQMERENHCLPDNGPLSNVRFPLQM